MSCQLFGILLFLVNCFTVPLSGQAPQSKIYRLKLQLVQNFAARVLTDTKKFDHISPVLRELGWPSIKDQLLVRDTTQVYKIVNGLAPLYLSSKLSKRSDAHHYNTRERDNLNLPLCRTVTAQRSFYYRAVSAWNSLTADTRNSPSLCTFKRSVKRELRVQTPYVKYLIFDLV